MRNPALAEDHLRRAASRLKAIQVLYDERSWADVVRESQEAVELCLKALLFRAQIEVPRLNDVSPLLTEHEGRLPQFVRAKIPFLVKVSKALRRDRDLAFYGSDDLTPSEFYSEKDAREALQDAREVHRIVDEGVRGARG